MSDLIRRIQQAQTRAAEDAVIADLEERMGTLRAKAATEHPTGALPAQTQPMRYAATRDATWGRANSLPRSGGVKFHIVAEPLKNEMSECGVAVVAMHRGVIEATPAAEVPQILRCQRGPCRRAWAIDAARSVGGKAQT